MEGFRIFIRAARKSVRPSASSVFLGGCRKVQPGPKTAFLPAPGQTAKRRGCDRAPTAFSGAPVQTAKSYVYGGLNRPGRPQTAFSGVPVRIIRPPNVLPQAPWRSDLGGLNSQPENATRGSATRHRGSLKFQVCLTRSLVQNRVTPCTIARMVPMRRGRVCSDAVRRFFVGRASSPDFRRAGTLALRGDLRDAPRHNLAGTIQSRRWVWFRIG